MDKDLAGRAVAGVRAFSLTVDGDKLVGEPAAGGFVHEGASVAVSDDGNTALVGAPGLGGFAGGAFVFVHSGSAWVQQGGPLVGTGASGSSEQGTGVALSADGNTAIISGPQGADGGAAWVFTRSGSSWAQDGSKLVATGLTDANVGDAVALSADGTTALLGAPGANGFAGAAVVFVRSASGWTQQGAPLVADCSGTCAGPNGVGEIGSGFFGASVALSADGSTAIIGAPEDNVDSNNAAVGATWVFTRSASGWSQQGPKLVASSAVGRAGQGDAVAVSNDGNTAMIGGSADDNGVGAAWIFNRSGSNWAEQAKLSGDGDYDLLNGVALSADGNTALLGSVSDVMSSTGGGLEFTRSGPTWTELEEIAGAGAVGNAEQGSSVALSGNAATALIGGSADNGNLGAAWAFGPPGTYVSPPPPTSPPSSNPTAKQQRPACRLRPSDGVALQPRKRRRHRRHSLAPVNTVAVRISCIPTATVKLTGLLSEPRPTRRRHGKRHVHRYRLGPNERTAIDGAGRTLLLHLPRRALAGLAHRTRASLSLKLSATDSAGTTVVRDRVAHIRALR